MKNINFFEQHVEKIVLAVALAGFGVMGYLAMQDVAYTTETGEAVTARTVEDAIKLELQRIQDGIDKLPPPTPAVPPYLNMYTQIAQAEPLDSTMSVSNVSFGPRNVPPGQSLLPPVNDWALITPAPVGPITDDPTKVEKTAVEERLLRAQALQVKVNTDPPQLDASGNPVPLAAGIVLSTHMVNVVVIDGYVPVGRMLLELLKATGKQQIPLADLQKALIYRVEITRQEQPTGGSWSTEWKEIKPAKGSTAPVEITWTQEMELTTRMTEVENNLKQILLPDFYRKEDGTPYSPPILTRPLPASIEQESQKLQQDITAARAGGIAAIRPTVPGGVGVTPGQPTPITVDQLKTAPIVPFTFWDDTVQPDHRYRYR